MIMELIDLPRGKPPVKHWAGHLYVIKCIESGMVNWRCVNSSSLNCPGLCQSSIEANTPSMISGHLSACPPVLNFNKLSAEVEDTTTYTTKSNETGEINGSTQFGVDGLLKHLDSTPPWQAVKGGVKRLANDSVSATLCNIVYYCNYIL